MPELPEVEVTRRAILPHLLGRTIKEVRTTRRSYAFLTNPEILKRQLTGRTIDDVERRGKYLIATLNDRSTLVLHLGMTGQLCVSGSKSARRKIDQHTHLQLIFKGRGEPVFFRDVRKFGKILWLKPGTSDERLDKLGPDALAVSPLHVWRALHKRSAAIKALLLNQEILAGVGNIYADEALFAAKIDPRKPGCRLKQDDVERLLHSLKRVLRRAIDVGGSSIRDFVIPDGHNGLYQTKHKVYGRSGKPCTKCKTEIRRILIGQRSTHFCPECQS